MEWLLSFIGKKSECTGCGACVSICPMNCISFVHDDEGFAYPEADSTCINCDRCHDVCPVLGHENGTYVEPDFGQFSVAGRHKSDSVWEKSSSGGAFSALCQSYCDVGDGIFGARFEGLEVVHDCVHSPDQIEEFLKSKYVQSNLGDSYDRARDMLESGRKVLFSGTPCQVAGLRNFLKREYDSLLCIDLICHGVGSPGVFEKYIEYLESTYSSRVVSFTFRNKKARWGRLLQHVIRIEFENGVSMENESDAYNTAFIQCLFLRPSCHECIYANLNRVGDITIGDFKKQHELLPEVKRLENMSTILVNTYKGKRVFDRLDEYMEFWPVKISDVVRTNNPLRQVPKMNDKRGEFFHDVAFGVPIDQALVRHITVPNLMRRMWILVPDRVRAVAKRGMRWTRK